MLSFFYLVFQHVQKIYLRKAAIRQENVSMKLIPLAEAELHRFPVQMQVSVKAWPKIVCSNVMQPSSFSVLSLQL